MDQRRACYLLCQEFRSGCPLIQPFDLLGFISVHGVRQHSSFIAREPAECPPHGCPHFLFARQRRGRLLPTPSPAIPVWRVSVDGWSESIRSDWCEVMLGVSLCVSRTFSDVDVFTCDFLNSVS